MVLVEWFTFTVFAIVAFVVAYTNANHEYALLADIFSIIFFILSGAEWWIGQTTNNLLGVWVIAPVVMLVVKMFEIAWAYFDDSTVKVNRF